jgi:hypothetical protein
MPAISFLPFLQTVPLGTRLLTLLLIFSTLSALFLSLLANQYTPSGSSNGMPGIDMPWLVLVPGESWKYPWTLITAGWVELSIFEVSLLG